MTKFDETRSTRSRTGSLSDSTNSDTPHVLNFNKPQSISSPGTYFLNDLDSGCIFSLYDSVLPVSFLEQLQTSIDALPTLKQYEPPHKGTPQKLPRLSAWYGPMEYRYSGITMEAYNVTETPEILAAYKRIAEKILIPNSLTDTTDSFLINKYRNGRDSCGEHSDNEPIICQSSPIVTLSLGTPRYILLRESARPGNAITIKLKPGSVFIMEGDEFQKRFVHSIPKDPGCTLPRTSITFRTCDPNYLIKHKVTSLAISQRHVSDSLKSQCSEMISQATPPAAVQTKVSKPRRNSTSRQQSPLPQSPLTNHSQSNSPAATPSKLTDSDSLPLSLVASLEAIDLLKEATLNKELSRHDLPTTGSVIDKRKKLKKAVQETHKKLLFKSLKIQPAEPETVINSITTLEASILDLNQEILAQRLTLDSLVLASSKDTTNKSVPHNHKPCDGLSTIEKRLEYIEELMESMKYKNLEVSDCITESKDKIEKVLNFSTESCNRLRTLQIPEPSKRLPPSKDNHRIPYSQPTKSHDHPSSSSQPTNQPRNNINFRQNTSTQSTSGKGLKPKKVVLVHDSQLNTFNCANFSSTFSVESIKGGSYNDLLNKNFRSLISKPNVDCYALQLGVNDYRYNQSTTTLNKAISDTKETINKLLSSSNAKILVSLPTPTPGPLQSYTTRYVNSISEFITETRGIGNNFRRVFTVNNHTNFLNVMNESENSGEKKNPLKDDCLHVNDYGVRKLCTNIKHGLYRAFGLRSPSRQTQRDL